MDFELSEEQRAITETTRRFVEKEMPRQQVLQWVRDKVEPPQEKPKELVYAADATGRVTSNISVQEAIDAMIRRKKGRD